MNADQRDFQVGQSASVAKVVTIEDIERFAEITGDFNPVHMDEEAAARTRFKGRIAHGMLGAGLISAVLGNDLPGPGAIYLSQSLKFLRPVRPGDRITAEVTVTDWKPEKAILTLDTTCRNESGEDVITGEAVLLVEGL